MHTSWIIIILLNIHCLKFFYQYTAISINVVGLNLQTYKSRPNGAMGIYCNLHITVEEINKFVFLHVEYFVFLPVKPFLYLFFRRYVVWIILFK